MSIPDAILEQLAAGLAGQPVWGVSRGLGSFLTVELGSTVAEPDGTRRGAWHLWVYMADWRIEYAGQVVVGSADLPGRIDEVLMQLGPRTFESFTIDPATGDTALQLSDEVRLVVLSSALPDDDSEAWILTQSDGTTLSGGPASRWTLEAAP